MKSLQQIEDYYVERGLKGDKLRNAIEEDGEYQQTIADRKNKLRESLDIPEEEADRYVLSTDDDYQILSKIHQLEQHNLSKEDKELVQFVRTQLELDWRPPIVAKLDELLSKYD